MQKIKDFIISYSRPLVTLGLLTLLFLISLLANFTYNALTTPSDPYAPDTLYGNGDCNIQGVAIRGDLFTYLSYDIDGNKLPGYEDTATSEEVMALIADAEYNDDILGTVIEVDSFGGSPTAAEEIAYAIQKAQKPVVAYVREGGTSAAYFAIAPADYIFALKSSNIGGIGITQSYVENVSQNQKEGLEYVQLSTGKFKDAGSPDKPLTKEERDLFMRDLNIINEYFMQSIALNRNIQIEKVRELADGSAMLGEQAMEVGLIDEIGGYDEAVMYLDGVIGEGASVCW